MSVSRICSYSISPMKILLCDKASVGQLVAIRGCILQDVPSL